ncbi:restriction endonuclease subunit S [Vibrio vulnificus]|uniref:restriction endonuclease subunit S n=1 Tax=Vibrio vulnificus TaxID=672 RepID=UPI001CDC0456|nr:restriction endonuclease subunit S [Vibrio vulnificus]MCA3956247.1 restriction endonuclease subunit S [Vibrio vulnificus]
MSFDYELPDGWSWKTIEEVQESPKGATITGPFGSSIGKKFFVEKGVPVIRGNNLSLGMTPFIDDGFVYVSEEKADELKRYKSIADDLLFTAAGTIGQVGIIPKKSKYDEYIISNKQLRARLDTTVVDPTYAYYWFSSKPMVEYIKRQDTGSTIPLINLGVLRSLPLPVPPLDVQVRIRRILKSFDKKIWINTQTNQTLEQMAQAIFKSWFVDFDPVKAKMNGEQPEGMDAATASLFPEKLDSETGIPVGWSQGVIADIAKVNAKSWTKKNQPEQVHYVDLANTKNGVIETVTSYDFSEAPSRARRILNSGDTIVGTVRPGNRSFAFIGDTEQPLTGSTGFAVLSPKEECWTSFVYLATTNDDSIDEYARLADGGAYPAIKPVVVADTPCVIPTTDIAQKFWQLTGAMLKKAHQNRLENEELAKLRDTLLPKLLSGEITLD